MTRPFVLIVDDDSALLQALPQMLSLRLPDVRVDTSASALEALERMRVNDYDAIVSDIKMPDMDGLTLLLRTHEICPETPTLLITGHGEHDLAVQALRGGAYDFIQKPIDRDYFVAALRRATQTCQMRRKIHEQQQALEEYAHSLEKQVQQRTEELVKANAAKDEFLSMASHELKTPLASLKAMVQLLHRQRDNQGLSLPVNVEGMERSIQRMEILVNDLLDTSLVETGMFSLNRTYYDLVALCQQIQEEYTTSGNFHIELEVLNEPIIAYIDVHRISQVILNLLSNAQKYSPRGSHILLKLWCTEHEAVVSVRDYGVGIPAEARQHLFERFYRVPGIEVQTGSSVGLGLGLYIARRVVERHGGHIEVEDAADAGSIFSVHLPLSTSEEA
jgi:two-component system, sensor histidine kinase and response regulator